MEYPPACFIKLDKVNILKELYKTEGKVFSRINVIGINMIFHEAFKMIEAEEKALKIVPELFSLILNNKISTEFIKNNIFELCFLFQAYSDNEILLLPEKLRIKKELENF